MSWLLVFQSYGSPVVWTWLQRCIPEDCTWPQRPLPRGCWARDRRDRSGRRRRSVWLKTVRRCFRREESSRRPRHFHRYECTHLVTFSLPHSKQGVDMTYLRVGLLSHGHGAGNDFSESGRRYSSRYSGSTGPECRGGRRGLLQVG